MSLGHRPRTIEEPKERKKEAVDVGDVVEARYLADWYKGVVEKVPDAMDPMYHVRCDRDPKGMITTSAMVRKFKQALPALRRVQLRLGAPPHRLGISCTRGPHGCHCITDVWASPGQPQVSIGDVILAIGSLVVLSLDEEARGDAINTCVANHEEDASYIWAVVSQQEHLAQSGCSLSPLLDRLLLIVQTGFVELPSALTWASEAWAVGDASFPGTSNRRKRKFKRTTCDSKSIATGIPNITGCWNITDRKLQYVFYQALGSTWFCGYMKHRDSDAPLLYCYGIVNESRIEYELSDTKTEKRVFRAEADIKDGLLLNGMSHNERKEVVNRFSASKEDVVSEVMSAMQTKHHNIMRCEEVGTEICHVEIGRDVKLKVVPLPSVGITLVQRACNSAAKADVHVHPGDEILLINGRDPKKMLSRERAMELQQETVHLTIKH